MDEAYLAHHGIKGQKWGVRRTPEQLGHKPTGKKQQRKTLYGALNEKLGDVSKKLKQVDDNVKAAKKAAFDPEDEREKIKQQLRKHPSQLMKYSHMLTRDEARELIDQIEFDRKLSDIRREEMQRGLRKVKDVSDAVQTVGNLINNGKTLYNNMAEVHNALVDAGIVNDKKWQQTGRPAEEDRNELKRWLKTASAEDVLANFSKLNKSEQDEWLNSARNKERVYEYTEAGKKAKAEKDSGDKNDSGKQNKESGYKDFSNVPPYVFSMIKENRIDDARRISPEFVEWLEDNGVL